MPPEYFFFSSGVFHLVETFLRFPDEARDFSLLHSVKTGFGNHPASYPMDNGDSSPGV
jgi:hypothetical protein